MRSKKFGKKLTLSKQTISNLSREDIIEVKGGGTLDSVIDIFLADDGTGDCLNCIGVTVGNCDFQSVPLDECDSMFCVVISGECATNDPAYSPCKI